MTLLAREDAARWLAAGLALGRVGAPGAALVAEAAPWLAAAGAELAELPPAGVIADLGRLLGGDHLAAAPPPVSDPALLAALRAYEDQVLARLAADPRLEDAGDALARLPLARRPAAVAFLVGALLERLGVRCTALPAAATRRATGKPAEDLAGEGFAALADPAMIARLTASYDGLVRAARQTRQLLGDREVFVLEHLDALASAARRVAVTQIVEAAEALGRELPRRLRRVASKRGAAPTQLDDESLYPTGGFAAVTTSGSLENLVTSELVYMEPEADVDLFDMRYVEGELLYYTRDESQFVRRRHELSFVFAAGARDARVKDEGVPWQRLVLALGLVVCAVRRVALTLGHEALLIRVRFVGAGSEEHDLGEERALAELLLAEWRERGVLEIDAPASLEECLAEAEQRSRRALSDVIVIDARNQPLPVSKAARIVRLSLENAHPRLSFPGENAPDEAPGSPWAAWQRSVLELLEGIV
jgi:hypothetical protein